MRRGDKRGLVMLEVTPKRTTLFQGRDDVRDKYSGLATLASFTVIDGLPGLVRT